MKEFHFAPDVPLEDRLLARIEKTDTCWLWKGALAAVGPDGDGYGHLAYQGKHYGAHRLAYELFVGPIPPNAEVCHRCDVRRCCNPAHLFVGTHADNMADAKAKDRMHPGILNGQAKLTEDDVRAIRREYAAGRRGGYTEMGRRYGVSETVIRLVVERRTWDHVTEAA